MKPLLSVLAALALSACAGAAPTPPAGTPAAAAAAINADIDALSWIAAGAIDAEALHRKASRTAHHPALRRELAQLARERRAMADRLQRELVALGAPPRQSGTLLGAGHRLFADIRKAFDDDEMTASGEALRGEFFLQRRMQRTLADPLISDGMKSLIRSLAASAEADRERLSRVAMQRRAPDSYRRVSFNG